jgi:hypothetical protein
MKKMMVGMAAIAALCLASIPAYADGPTDPPPPPKVKHFGALLDVGVPDGAALGLVVRPVPGPKFYWLKLNVAGTYNGLAPGLRGGIQLDPIKFPIRLTLNADVGHSFAGNPGSFVGKTLPDISYTYANLHGGLEMGGWNGFTFFLHAGPTWMNVQTGNFNSVINDPHVTFSDPHANATIVPTVKLGFTWLFI